MSAPTPGQILDGLLGLPAQLERLIDMTTAGQTASQAAFADLQTAINAEKSQVADRVAALERQAVELARELGATEQQLASLDTGIATQIRSTITEVQAILPDQAPATGGETPTTP